MRISRRVGRRYRVSMHPLTAALLGWLALPFLAVGLLLGGMLWLLWQIARLAFLAVLAIVVVVRSLRERQA
jgi:hypothetical protein